MVVSFVISLFRTDGFIIAYTGLSTRTLWSSVHDVTLFSSFRCNPHFTLRLSCSFQSLLTLNLLHLASVNVVENFFSRRPAYNEERMDGECGEGADGVGEINASISLGRPFRMLTGDPLFASYRNSLFHCCSI